MVWTTPVLEAREAIWRSSAVSWQWAARVSDSVGESARFGEDPKNQHDQPLVNLLGARALTPPLQLMREPVFTSRPLGSTELPGLLQCGTSRHTVLFLL